MICSITSLSHFILVTRYRKSPTNRLQSQIQDFPKEAAPFVWSAKSTRFSGGGGGSNIMFPWSPKADAIQWGGGVVPWSPKADAIQCEGGGVVAEFFRGLRKPTRFSGGGGSPMNFPLMGPFYIFRLSQRGRGPGPPESATGLLRKNSHIGLRGASCYSMWQFFL